MAREAPGKASAGGQGEEFGRKAIERAGRSQKLSEVSTSGVSESSWPLGADWESLGFSAASTKVNAVPIGHSRNPVVSIVQSEACRC